MKLLINGTEHELKFGIKFIKTLDEKYGIQRAGQNFGQALSIKLPFLLQEDVTVLSEIINAAVKGTVTENQVDNAIEEFVDENSLEDLFELVIEGLKNSNFTQKKINEVIENQKTQGLTDEENQEMVYKLMNSTE